MCNNRTGRLRKLYVKHPNYDWHKYPHWRNLNFFDLSTPITLKDVMCFGKLVLHFKLVLILMQFNIEIYLEWSL